MRRLLALAVGLLLLSAGTATAAPAWRLDVQTDTTAAPGSVMTYLVQMTNVGDAAVDPVNHPLTFTVTLPSGVTALGALIGPPNPLIPPNAGWDCSSLVIGAQSLTCENHSLALRPTGFATLTLDVSVAGDAAGVVTSAFTLSGGDASEPSASTVEPTTVTSEPPPFGVAAFDGTVLGDPAGTPYRQAGGHPYAATVSLDFNTVTNPAPLKGQLWPVEPVKDVLVDLPPGFVGDPTATETCTADELAAGGLLAMAECPPSAQVGTALVRINGGDARAIWGPLPVFNMVPPPEVPARFGFNVSGTVVTLDGALRSDGDYGLSVRVRDVPQGLAIAGATLTFWGVPADPVHDPERACPGEIAPWQPGGPICQNGGARKAFLRNPTSCTPHDVGLPVDVALDSWAQPGVWKTARFVSHLPKGYPWAPADWGPPAGTTGCEAVPFQPDLAVTPASREAGVPSGYVFELTLPQSDRPEPIGQADVRRAVVQLPSGVRVNPAAADGLAGCSPAQVGLRSLAEPLCPNGSRVGTVSIVTPLLDAPLEGAIYLAAPHDNPFDSLLAVYVVARGPGLIVKLAGRVESDPLSGQLSAVFDDLPQLPFSAVRFVFDGGPRAVLVNPPVCGVYAAAGELTSWSGAVRAVGSSFDVNAGCFGVGARPFVPRFAAGVESPVAGGSSPFHLRVTREDADEELRRVTVRLPRGLLGRLADVVLCSSGDASAGTCPDGSLIGRVMAGAGAGPLPFYIGGGRVYVTRPYGGAPFGLSVTVPAVAGPFDLGLVVVRAAVFVDRRTAAVRAVTDPLPVLLQGIPLQLRDVRVAVDRPRFMVLPTGCGEKRVRGVLESVAGRVVGAAARFQVGDCARLPFHPRLRFFVGSRGHTRARQSTPLTAVLTQQPGEAGIRRVSVTLPSVLSAQIPVIEDACSPEEFAADRCEAARIGTAVATTPLLRDPLSGGAYLVRRPGQALPDLIIALRGQVSFDLVGRVAIPGGRHLSATFSNVPDVPIRRFVLRFHAGSRGVVGLAHGLCTPGRPPGFGKVRIASQSGASRAPRTPLATRGCD